MLLRGRLKGVRRKGVGIHINLLPLYRCPGITIGKFTGIILNGPNCVCVNGPNRTHGSRRIPSIFRPLKGRFLFGSSFCFILYRVAPIRFLRPSFMTNRQITRRCTIITNGSSSTLRRLRRLNNNIMTTLTNYARVRLGVNGRRENGLLGKCIQCIMLTTSGFYGISTNRFVLTMNHCHLKCTRGLLRVIVILLGRNGSYFITLTISRGLILRFLNNRVIIAPLRFIMGNIRKEACIIRGNICPPNVPTFNFTHDHIPIIKLSTLFHARLTGFTICNSTYRGRGLTIFLFEAFLRVGGGLRYQFRGSLF